MWGLGPELALGPLTARLSPSSSLGTPTAVPLSPSRAERRPRGTPLLPGPCGRCPAAAGGARGCSGRQHRGSVVPGEGAVLAIEAMTKTSDPTRMAAGFQAWGSCASWLSVERMTPVAMLERVTVYQRQEALVRDKCHPWSRPQTRWPGPQ